jgi:hypothetical protein
MVTTESADDLPYVDEHAIVVERGAAETWEAVRAIMDGTMSAGSSARGAKLLGCRESTASGPRPLAVGSTIPGFRVTVAAPGEQLSLEGRHRFSRYALIFRIDELGPGRSRVRAETRAVFPGPLGRVYGGLVVGTRGHVLAVRRQLGAIKRRAERS